jgi:DNA polymerase III alpha subunit
MNPKVDACGRLRFHGDDAVELLMRGLDLTSLLIEETDAIRQYNQACREHDKIDAIIPPITTEDPESDTARRIATWFIPDEFRSIAVREQLLAMCERDAEIARVNLEMDMFEARGLLPVLQLMFFLVDHCRRHSIVWGVGRGSSVASYCLFLIGVHKCDSLHHNLDITEFLR